MPTKKFTITDGIILATIAFSAFAIGATAATILIAKILGAAAILLFFGATLATFSPITLAIVAFIGLVFGALVLGSLILNIMKPSLYGRVGQCLIPLDGFVLSNVSEAGTKVVFLGNMNVGKSALVNALASEEFVENYKPTFGVNYKTTDIVLEAANKTSSVQLQMWDCSGNNEIYGSTLPAYIRGADVIALVFDVTDGKSFSDAIDTWKKTADANTTNAEFVLIGTKAELAYERQVPKEKAEQWATNHNASYLEVSAKTGYNVDIARQTIAEQCAAALNPKGSPVPNESSSLTSRV